MKKIFSMLLVLTMVVSLFGTMTISANNGGTLTVVAGNIVNGQVEVKVDYTGNPGVAGVAFSLVFDNTKLTPASYTKGTVLGGAPLSNLDQGGDMAECEYVTFMWSNPSNVKADGTLLTVVFDVNSGDWEETPLEITYNPGDIADQSFNDVNPAIVNASVGLPVIEFTFNDATKVYNGQEQSIVATGNAEFSYDKNTYTDAGTYEVTATATKAGFRKTTKKATLTINPKAVSITGITADNKVYDGTEEAVIKGGTLNGVISGDDVTAIIPETGYFNTICVGNYIPVTIEEIALEGEDKANYVLTQPTGIRANISSRVIKVKADDKGMIKGGVVPELTYKLIEGTLVEGDEFVGDLYTAGNGTRTGSFPITKGTLKVKEIAEEYNNYYIDFVAGTLNVSDKYPQNITVSEIKDATYGDAPIQMTVTADPDSELDVFSFESSDTNVAEISAEGLITIKKAGTTEITVKQAGDDTYAEFVSKQTLTVAKKIFTVKADPKTKRIGTADPELTYTYVGEFVGEDAFTGALSRVAGEEIGKYDITIGTLAINDNYEISYEKAIFEILDKDPQTIAVADFPEKKYGDEGFDIAVTPDEKSGLNAFTFASDNEAVATVDATGKVTIIGAGEANITITEPGNEDYAAVTVTKKLVVKKVPLTIKVDAIVVTYGDEIVPNITYTGFIKEETKDILTKAVAVSGFAAKPNAGEYDITLSGAEAANYEITYENAKLTVNKKDITITELKVFNKAADETTAATINTSSLVFEGLVFGDDVSVDLTKAVAEFESADVAAEVPVSITGIELIGAHAANYNFANPEFATKAEIKENVTATEIAEQIINVPVVKDAEALVLPNVPEGFTIEVEASDNEDVITADGEIIPVAENTTVNLTFRVLSANGEEAEFGTVTIAVEIPAATKVNVTAIAGENGTVTGSGEFLKNTEVTVTATPNSGYRFSGWYNGETLISSALTYTFKAEEDIELEAKFNKKSSGGSGGGGGGGISPAVKPEEPKEDEDKKDEEPSTDVTPSAPAGKFSDVSEKDWFFAYVDELAEKGIIAGNGNGKFAPNDKVTREQFLKMIIEAADIEVAEAENTFADVADQWYKAYVLKAKAFGIVNGVSDTEFGIGLNITRQDMAVMIARTIEKLALELEAKEVEAFADNANISDYAAEAVEYMKSIGLIEGYNNEYRPQDNLTRAEAAKVISELLKLMK